MNISVFHYHLNPGGVTRIIESQVAGFRKLYPESRIQVMTGYCENMEYYNRLNVNVLINEQLNYLTDKNFKQAELDNVFDAIFIWINAHIESDEILHVHNLNLGKNPILTLVFNKFLNEGFTLVNHAHDFAEDRPLNMNLLQKIIGRYYKKDLSKILYPNSSNYLLGVLNQFDYDRVINYGLPNNRVFLWPNPVFVEMKTKRSKSELRQELVKIFNIPNHHKIITYPVRVIQRKNIGELILLSQLYSNTCTFMVTLPPRNPIEIQHYKQWKIFCSENNIPLIFEAGTKCDFETIVVGSDYCITTSLKEGFGMAYLEPWLMGTAVIGRNINYVTADIIEKGVLFPLLYDELLVPVYNENIDFKTLSSDKQQLVIKQLIEGVLNKEHVFEINSFLTNFPPEIGEAKIIMNQRTIKQQFSLDTYAERIFRAYKTIS